MINISKDSFIGFTFKVRKVGELSEPAKFLDNFLKLFTGKMAATVLICPVSLVLDKGNCSYHLRLLTSGLFLLNFFGTIAFSISCASISRWVLVSLVNFWNEIGFGFYFGPVLGKIVCILIPTTDKSEAAKRSFIYVQIESSEKIRCFQSKAHGFWRRQIAYLNSKQTLEFYQYLMFFFERLLFFKNQIRCQAS